MAHQRARCVDAIDLGGNQVAGEPRMERRSVSAQFQHFAKDRNAPAVFVLWRGRENSYGGLHGFRIGVIAFIDQDRFAALDANNRARAAPFHRREAGKRADHRLKGRADRIRRRGILGAAPVGYHRTPGFGDSDWTAIISELRRVGFEGSIDIEGWHDPVYRDALEMTGQVAALNHLKTCRGGDFVPNPEGI